VIEFKQQFTDNIESLLTAGMFFNPSIITLSEKLKAVYFVRVREGCFATGFTNRVNTLGAGKIGARNA